MVSVLEGVGSRVRRSGAGRSYKLKQDVLDIN